MEISFIAKVFSLVIMINEQLL